MPKTEASPRAMKLARAIFDNLYGDKYRKIGPDVAEPIVLDIATIIDKHTEPTWIPCSERMPAEEDADSHGGILVGNTWAHCPVMAVPWDSPEIGPNAPVGEKWTHWQRSPNDPKPNAP